MVANMKMSATHTTMAANMLIWEGEEGHADPVHMSVYVHMKHMSVSVAGPCRCWCGY